MQEYKKKKNERKGFFVLYLTVFLSSLAFSITIPSMWPYLKLADRNATKKYLGLFIAMFSIGQFISAPLCGLVSQRMMNFKYPLVITIIFIFIGNFLYVQVFLITSNEYRYWALTFSRFVTGFGAGNIAITRAYITLFSKPKDQTGRVALLSAFQGLGYVLGPCFQTIFAFLGFPGYIQYKYFQLNMYTGCSYFGIFTSIINIVTVIFFMKNKYPIQLQNAKSSSLSSLPHVQNEMIKKAYDYDAPIYYKEKFTQFTSSYIPEKRNTESQVYGNLIDRQMILIKDENTQVQNLKQNSKNSRKKNKKHRKNLTVQNKEDVENIEPPLRSTNNYKNAILISVIFLLLMLFYSALETILNPLLMDQLGIGYKKATTYSSLLLMCSGISCIIILVSVKVLSQRLSSRVMLLFGQGSLVLTCLVLIPIFGPKPFIKYHDEVGCPINEQTWCDSYPALQLWNFILAIIFFTLGFSFVDVSVTILFSKSLKIDSQTFAIGILIAIGSIGRIMGPFYSSTIYSICGPSICFGILGGVKFIMIFFILLVYKQLPN